MSAFHSAQAAPEPWSQRVWRALTHPLLLVVLLALTGAALIGHSTIPQLPTALANDPIARSQWLADASAVPGGGIIAALGLFDVSSNIALRVLLPLLAAILLLRLGERLVLAWRTRSLTPPLESLPTTTVWDSQQDGQFAAAECEAFVRQSCSRWRGEALTEGPGEWFGDRNHRASWFTPLFEAGLLLALLAFTLNLRLGWQTELIYLDPGAQTSLTPLSAATIRLDETPLAEPCCAPGQAAPLAVDARLGMAIRQLALHPALAVSAAANGEPIELQAIEQGGVQSPQLALRFPQARTERAVAIPQHNLFLRIVNTGPHTFSLQALDASENVLLSEEITSAATLPLEGLTLDVRPTYFVAFQVVYRPWSWLLIPTLLLALAGLLLRWRFPYFRLGLRTNEAGVALRRQSQYGARPSAEAIAQWAGGHNL